MKIGRFLAFNGANILAVGVCFAASVRTAADGNWVMFGVVQTLMVLNAAVLGIRFRQLIKREGRYA